jgi:hypothetical protein
MRPIVRSTGLALLVACRGRTNGTVASAPSCEAQWNVFVTQCPVPGALDSSVCNAYVPRELVGDRFGGLVPGADEPIQQHVASALAFAQQPPLAITGGITTTYRVTVYTRMTVASMRLDGYRDHCVSSITVASNDSNAQLQRCSVRKKSVSLSLRNCVALDGCIDDAGFWGEPFEDPEPSITEGQEWTVEARTSSKQNVVWRTRGSGARRDLAACVGKWEMVMRDIGSRCSVAESDGSLLSFATLSFGQNSSAGQAHPCLEFRESASDCAALERVGNQRAFR